MGWDIGYHYTRKSDVVGELLERYNRNPEYNVLAWKSTTSGLWTVVEHKTTGHKSIIFDLIERRSGAGYPYKAFGVKGMDESMGPYFYDCPAKFLAMVPVANPAWRERWAAANGVKLS